MYVETFNGTHNTVVSIKYERQDQQEAAFNDSNDQTTQKQGVQL
jgi:hypothetical protein